MSDTANKLAAIAVEITAAYHEADGDEKVEIAKALNHVTAAINRLTVAMHRKYLRETVADFLAKKATYKDLKAAL